MTISILHLVGALLAAGMIGWLIGIVGTHKEKGWLR